MDTVPGGTVNSLTEDQPLPSTPNDGLLAGAVDTGWYSGEDFTDEDLPFPSTPVSRQVRSSALETPIFDLSNKSMPMLSTPRATNADSHRAGLLNLDDHARLSSTFSDPLLFPSISLDSFLLKQNLGDPRIDEILSNQKKIVESLNSLHGLVQQLIHRPHTGTFSEVVDLPVIHIDNHIAETIAHPSTIAQPSTTAHQSTVAQPSTLAKPSTAVQPSTGLAQPSIYFALPSTIAQPTTIAHPSTVAQPSSIASTVNH